MRKQRVGKFILGFVLGFGGMAQAKEIFVDPLSSAPSSPYANTTNAALTIQAALDVSVDGDVIRLVPERTYTPAAELVVTNDIDILSWTLLLEHAPKTVIDGQNAHRVFNLGTNDVELIGVSVVNGSTGSDGGGIYCANNTPNVWNCIISGNSAGSKGSGMYRGTASSCTFSSNTGAYYGGGAYETIATDCTFIDNEANQGAGLYRGTATDCTIQNNQASQYAGGMYAGSATNCLIIGNSTPGSGGGLYLANAVGCAIFGNSSGSSGGGMYQGTATHCTITENHANTGGGMDSGRANNSILWNNTANDEYTNTRGTSLYSSCSPEATFGSNGCITNNPQLITPSHIFASSPCIGAGNATYATGTDIDGESWNSLPAMGCDEVDIGNVTGSIHPHNDLLDRVITGQEIYFNAYIDGSVTQTILDFGDGTTLTNSTDLAYSHAWGYGNFNVILTGYNDNHVLGVSITNLVVSRLDSNTTIYVSNDDGNDSNDGESWATAKKTIQAGVDAQIWSGGLILVSNGTYSVTSEIVVSKDVRIQSLNGLSVTTVQGDNHHQSFYLNNQHCWVEGFTIRDAGGYSVNGSSGGGAIYCSGSNPIVENCLITENNSGGYGGGVMLRGTATNCTFSFNSGGNGPGAMEDGIAIDCLFENNQGNGGGSGGGAMGGGEATRCLFKNNTNVNQGGAMYEGKAYDCQFIGNSSDNSGGGTYRTDAENCVFNGNKAKVNGGGMNSGTATHCTFTANRAASGGGTYSTTLDHCIVWYNTALESFDNTAYGTISYSCSPELSHGTDGNITNMPQLVSASHIAITSPCAGSGSLWLDTLDIDGEHWRSTPAMGCDEPADPVLGTPTITIEGPTDIPVGYKAFYTVDIQGAIERDRIDFGDGFIGTSTGINPIFHTWSAPGTYNMVLTVWNNNDQDSYSITNPVTVRAADFNAIYVTTNGNDSANGRSWAAAKQTIQAAIDEQDLTGGQVVVSNGVYALAETIQIDKEIQLIGFNGAEETILDGGSTNLYTGIACMDIEDTHTTVTGFTFRNGRDRDSNNYYSGGGVFCNYSLSPKISNCIFLNNSATEGGAMAYGTAIDCVFSNNYANKGGGLYSGQATRCEFTDNEARDGGAGQYGGTATDCTFTENRLEGYSYGNGAGMSKGTANNCSFIRNDSNGYGGGMNEGTANDCLFIGNKAVHGGGGMRNSVANRCTFVDNLSLYSGGGSQSGTANSCSFSGNRAYTTGGGSAYTTLNNCTLTGNHAKETGGGAQSGSANNSIVWNNTADEGGNDLSSVNLKYTCSPDAPHGTDGCITNNPQLVSASHIAESSLCRGSGDPLLVVSETDIDGEPWNAMYPSMGCDEIGATLSGPIEMALFGPSPIRVLSSGDYTALFNGQVSKTIVDFGHGTPLTNAVGSITHFWPAPSSQAYDVILTGFNETYPLGTAYTQTVDVVGDTSDIHVWKIGDDLADGLTWATAKKTIQAGIDAQQVVNGQVIVDYDLYNIGSTITIGTPIHLLGYNANGNDGSSVVVDAGSSNRCFDVGAVACTIEGFTIQNGATALQGYTQNAGGGIRCETTDPRIYNCTITDCTAYFGGAIEKGSLVYCSLFNNVAIQGGAAYQSNLDDCTVSSNSATYGGGVYSCQIVSGCTLSNNYASSHGGAAYSCSIITNCTLTANTSVQDGGGAYQCTLDFCIVTDNDGRLGGGMHASTADRCLFASNHASIRGGGSDGGTAHNCVYEWNYAIETGGGAYGTTLYNCTVVSNVADVAGGSFGSYVYNSIIWDNGAWTEVPNAYPVYLHNSCSPEADHGQRGNITNAPLFVAYAPGFLIRGSDYYLDNLSPCLNAGNNGYVETDIDFNGWPRISYGTVDMGANEMYFFASDTDGDEMPDGWELENFGGTTNAVASGDADGDQFDNRSEYIAGTEPNDDTSYLRITQSEMVDSEGDTQITLHWSPSVEGRIYGVQWSTNLVDGFQDRGLTLPYPSDQIGFGNDLPESFYKISVELDD